MITPDSAKTILITGATDGIGLAAAEQLVSQGHNLLIHGRNRDKLSAVADKLNAIDSGHNVETYCADLSSFAAVKQLIAAIKAQHSRLDVLINNAGVLKTSETRTADNLDVRFMVNTFAPYLLAKELLPLFDESGRIVNLSSAAQAPVDVNGLMGLLPYDDDMTAYAQSKLAITMWSHYLGVRRGDNQPSFISVNPGSLLATNMVKEGFGIEGNDLSIGADILVAAALSEQFAKVSGQYWDNDDHQFGGGHADINHQAKVMTVVAAIDRVIARHC
ncbi:MAG: SDR family NAD(P)-dependent oxidoreductase [Kangiellaceae bacterium]|jgi:NAD(P)-dependent dehydrogenase (short-subunit alcohol dehydrogenase family)|nr:SDR family NAD(P)-dependent oxidoreductase [Kangiellaceae bacterium]